jgi:uncharacterized NAD(P)/FAD-binding protein YdhS
MSTNKNLSVSIAGGGASAVMVLTHLSRHAEAKKLKRITIYDRAGRFAQGIAYSTDNTLHLLNVRANNMSAFPEDPAHLVRWLAERNYPYKDIDFIPRPVYALYLRDLWDGAVEALQEQGCEIVLKKEEFKKELDTVTVIATGNAFPYAPKGVEELSARDGYHAHPWAIRYDQIQGDVVIPGTGLSMIDTVVALDGAGFKGNITAISRNGLIPATHTDPAIYKDFFAGDQPKTTYGLISRIRREIKSAAKNNIPWQAVIDAIRPHTNNIWRGLEQKEQKKIRRVMALWNIHRHRMAPEASAVIERLKKEGRLKIVKDSVERVEKGLVVKGRKNTYKADYVVNCLGYGRDEKFCFDEKSEKDGIFALGPALTGYYFETVAMPEIRVQARRIAGEILNR